MLQLKELEEYTMKVMDISSRKWVTETGGHEKYCLVYEIIREIYNRGSGDGFTECKQRIINEVITKK